MQQMQQKLQQLLAMFQNFPALNQNGQAGQNGPNGQGQGLPRYNLMGRVGGNNPNDNNNTQRDIFNSVLGPIGMLLQYFMSFSVVMEEFLQIMNPKAEVKLDTLLQRGCQPQDATTLLQFLNRIEDSEERGSFYMAIKQDNSPQLSNTWNRLIEYFEMKDMKKEVNELLNLREANAAAIVRTDFAAANAAYSAILRNIRAVGFENHKPEYQKANARVRNAMLKEIFVAKQQAAQPNANVANIDNNLTAELRRRWTAHRNSYRASLEGDDRLQRYQKRAEVFASRLEKAKHALKEISDRRTALYGAPVAGQAPFAHCPEIGREYNRQLDELNRLQRDVNQADRVVQNEELENLRRESGRHRLRGV